MNCLYENCGGQIFSELRNNFSILTTPANPLMENIHNLKKRMPLILSPEDEQKWIDPDLTTEAISALKKPFPQIEMTAYTISKLANGSKNNRSMPEILNEVYYPELPPFQ